MADPNDRFKVDLDLLDEAVSAMGTFGTDVDTWLEDVDRHIAELHLSWDSQAAAAQRAAHDDWAAGVREMRENLDDLRAIAQKAHGNYSTAVDTNTRMWP
ncbi:WXG100 family type VII secretion target [Nocardia kruczakiae]|uniref:ESAT-6-like protein n=1 Tax=Nocardia kruczakiae TaxID=261477 RepID=A0ABU1XP68_9NOCA|nr:WXG100 family type VII secretion target [Nocardia kruczakiae]MDR7171777.1 WXG100 family type VII secretion target [Nocardia kruczakiae]